MGNLRVLVVTHNYPRFPGDPAGAFVRELARGVASSGAQVHVVAPHDARVVAHEDAGVPVTRFRYGPAPWERVAYAGLGLPGIVRRALMLPFFLFRFDRAVRRAVLHVRPDVIHAHWWFPGGWLATRGTPPAVVTTHGSDVRLAERFWALRRVARRVVGRAAAVTAASEFLARQVERLAGGATSVQVTRMPVDEVPLARVRDRRRVHPPRILFAGNLVASKGVDVLIRALAVLKRRGVECRLRLVGSGPQAGRLDALARQLGVADWIERSPLVTRDAMPGEYGAATVTVLPSRRDAEGLGLVLVESLIAGTPVVGTRTGGIPEVVRHEETGLLAREGDADDLALQLQRMLESYALRQSTVARGQTLVRARHDPRVLSEQLLRLYHDVLERHP